MDLPPVTIQGNSDSRMSRDSRMSHDSAMSEKSELNLTTIQKRLDSAKGAGYWRSLDELFSTDGFKDYLHREFPRQASEWIDDPADDISSDNARRNFLKIMGASLALAGLSACTKQPAEAIVPYVVEPEKLSAGKPLFYATAFPISGVANPVLVETHEFRPTKVEGNPQHPASMGSTDVPTQASILGLYDPDRLQTVNYIGEIRSHSSFLSTLLSMLAKQKDKAGSGIRILTETVTSPTLYGQLQDALKAYPQAKWHQWDPIGNGRRNGSQLAFGQYLNTIYKFDQAEVVVAIDANFLGNGPGGVRYAMDFAAKRGGKAGTVGNRFYAVESTPSSTGSKADHRVAMKPSEIVGFARSLATALNGGAASSKFVRAVAKDLQSARGRSIVIAGEDQSPEVHAVVHAINQSLGNFGKTVILTASLEAKPVDQLADLKSLVLDLNAGAVDLLLILGGNPVYSAPPEWNLRGAIQLAKTRVRLGLYDDETSEVCQWLIPEAHAFEQWSDAPAYDGTITLMQPLIAPLYGGKSVHELLAAFTEVPDKSGYQILRDFWNAKHPGPDFETWWKHTIHDGLAKDSGLPEVKADAKLPAASSVVVAAGHQVSFHFDPYVLDGRYSNNAWLQELPRPVTRLTWDNAVLLSPKTAKELSVENEARVEVAVGGSKVEGAVWIVPGQPEGSVAVALGYGRTRSGRAGNGAGFNANVIRSAANSTFAAGAKITKLDGKFELAAVQHHFAMEGREPVKSASAETLRKDPLAIQKMSETPNSGLTVLPSDWQYKGYAWGMAIDLSGCTGCNTCVVACQAENNIPVTGKAQVLKTREMHWIRVDRYYSGSEDNPEAFFQPVGCHHCENAPCEIVCPVAATEHDAEGLNNMVYNRCVGTRYCSNNCPYKVRRFNFLMYNDWETESLKLQRNPDVTVRSRGVMEKCTYCIQRINYAKITAEKEDRRVKDGEIVTACEAACPSQAIAFGDLNDPNSKVSRWKREKTNYSLLGELNTRPRTTYLADIRNPNPELGTGGEG